ncbi:hypothetical protein BST95_10625 [Halioglobus japonicus]|nr:hypothetical protein BST95_10625 [Halioglobus japonicus]
MLQYMAKSSPSLENHLLIASGVVATGLVAVVNCLNFQVWPDFLVYLLFGVIFAVKAYDEELGLSRRVTVSGTVAMFVLSVIALIMHTNTLTPVLAAVLMASAPYHLSARQSWLLFLVANATYFLVFELTWETNNYQISFVSMIALQAFAITSSLTKQREVAAQEMLSRQNSELLAARAVLAQQSQAEERLRIAGHLHDTVGHQLTALGLQLEALAHQAPDALRPRIEDSQALARELLEGIRSTVRQMTEERRDDLASAIRRLASVTPGVTIEVDRELPALPAELTQQLVFCLQEGIHNAIRHGGADHLDIHYAEGVLSIADNGRGLRGTIVPGFGLENIRTRLAPFGGEMALTRRPDGGCVLALTLPQLERMPA